MRVCGEKRGESAPLTEYRNATTPGIVSLYETAGNAVIDSEIIAWNALLSHLGTYARRSPDAPRYVVSIRYVVVRKSVRATCCPN